MLVRAIEKGYYGKLRYPGDEFEISSEKLFSERWMEPVKTAKKPGPKPKAKESAEDQPTE